MSYSEENLVKKYLPKENIQSLHDALQDILILKKLVDILGISDDEIKKECISLRKIKCEKIKKINIQTNKASLQFLNNIIKPRIIMKMAREGINQKVLFDTYKKDSTNGIKVLLSTSVNRKVRVTSEINIINIIHNKIKTLCDI